MTLHRIARLRQACVAVALVGLMTVASFGASAALLVADTTAGAPTWNRPVANGNNPPVPPTSTVGTDVRYDSWALQVSLTGSYTFLTTSTNPSNWDNYSFLYQTSFNPTQQFTNVLIGNDDVSQGTLNSGFTINLTAGTTYILVVTGFGNSDFGAYSVDVSGRGTASLVTNVPEPATLALLGAGLLGFAAVRGRRRAA